MICSVIGCGQTVTLWDGSGYSIGVNDCWKYNITTDRLIVVNSLTKWQDRRSIVLRSRPKDGLYSQIASFNHHPNYKHIGPMQRWRSTFKPGTLYHCSTSPFIALSMAHNIGFKEIVLWGVDLVDHPNVKGNSLKKEVMYFESFTKALGKQGTKVYLGTDFGALKDILPVYK